MIRVMSFNIRTGVANDGGNHWQRRRELTLARVHAFAPDLLGLQECRDDAQAEFVRARLPEYHFFGVRRQGPGDSGLEMAPLLFRRAAFDLRDSGCFWLSEAPEVPGSQSWGSAYPRTVSWVRLARRSSGEELVFVNTHFDYEPRAIDGAARCLRDWLAELGETPRIVSGDFNAGKESAAHRLLTADGTLVDAYRQAHPREKTEEDTYHAFGRPEEIAPEERGALDWILISAHFRVLEARLDRSRQGDLFPSDHYPLTAILEWQTRDRP